VDVLFCPRDGTPLASSRNPSLTGAPRERDPYLGIELPGQIRLDHLIGIGSMGRVYRAFQGGIERDVAVKVLHRELSGNPELVGRFHREAKVASRLVHPNVVQVLMTGALPPSRDVGLGGELYLVMEHLDGISLLSALAAAGTSGEGQALPLQRALHIALQICDAVGEAHAQGIVHRDLKPENVMLVRRGDDPDYVKVLDFGIARLDWADRGMVTQAGLIFGTAKYISPEGAEGQHVDPAADVYSIATMLYQMLAGRTPFEGESPVALLVQHTHAPPPPLRSIARASYVPEPLAAAIMANLCKKPAERAANARVLGRDLIAAARAGGLFPEDIASQSTLMSPASLGAVKLQSKERTRSHELSAGLASRIGGVAATGTAAKPAPDAGVTQVVPEAEGAPRAAAPATPPPPAHVSSGALGTLIMVSPQATASPAASSEVARTVVPAAPLSGVGTGTEVPLADAATPGPGTQRTPTPGPQRTPPPAPVSAPRLTAGDTQIDLDETGHADVEIRGPTSTVPGAPVPAEMHAPQATPVPVAQAPTPVPASSQVHVSAPAGPLTTMVGTETTLEGGPASRRGRARTTRIAVLVACLLAAIPMVVLGGRRLGGGAAQSDSPEGALEEARDAMRRRAWDAPPGHNFKELTDAAVKRWPHQTAFADLRREAAVNLVTDALGRKYAGDVPEATRLVQLALEMDPQLTTAQHLAAELAVKAPDAAPAASSGTPGDKGPKPPRLPRGRDVRPPTSGEPRDARPPAKVPGPPPGPTGAVLPPPPAPKPSERPPPASTGPWL
jgi:serine/threonine-protein kinase